MKEADAAICPTTQAAPVVAQPPKFSKLLKTSAEEALGASTQRGMQITKKPTTNATKITPSNRGKCLAPNELKQIANTPTAMVIRVVCLLVSVLLFVERSSIPRITYHTLGV
jgi:hypothetical protein